MRFGAPGVEARLCWGAPRRPPRAQDGDLGPYLRLRQLVVVVGEAEVEAPSVKVH